MNAVIWTQYGPPEVLKLKEVENPTPEPGEVLVKIHAATVTAGDCEMRRLQLPLILSFLVRLYAGLIKPKRITILGQELAGEVVAVGRGVTTFKPGDQVYGTTGFGFGAYAEYICLPAEPGDAEGVLAIKPGNLSYEEATAVPTAGLEALHYLREGKARPGVKVLIIGGGGSIGTLAIQLAKHYGAEVTAVDAGGKQSLMRSLGADQVIDYTEGDYTKSGKMYDLIIDVVGRKGLSRRLKLLEPRGDYFLAFARLLDLLLSLWMSITDRKRLRIESAHQEKADLEFLAGLFEDQELQPVIDRSYPLQQAAAAHRYAESGRKAGNVVFSVQHAADGQGRV